MCGELYIVYICRGNLVKMTHFLCVFGVKSSIFLGWVGKGGVENGKYGDFLEEKYMYL